MTGNDVRPRPAARRSMLHGLRAQLRKFFMPSGDRQLAAFRPQLAAINGAANELQGLSDAALRERMDDFRRACLAGQPLDDFVAPVFAMVREAARRTIGQSPYDCQLLGGLALHHGLIAEMHTGEGKTLAATLPAALNALAGKGVHIVTANDYLATRDATWMTPIYHLLGLSVGLVTTQDNDDARRKAYGCDITYGTAGQFGLDYLRDHTRYDLVDRVQRGHAFVIVDEADSVLIDDASTPLALAGEPVDHSGFYGAVDQVAALLRPSDFEAEVKSRRVTLTDSGIERATAELRNRGLLKSQSLHDIDNVALLHHLNEALRARLILKRDIDYVVHDREIVLVEAVSGRMMFGHRFADGLHQALEAKESLAIQPDSRTLATITFQNYFRLYRKLAGMTGTARVAQGEFEQIYGCDVLAIPPHRPFIRQDDADQIHATEQAKWQAIVALIEEAHARGQPVLVGTASIERSEWLATLLAECGWKLAQPGLAHPPQAEPHTKSFALLNARHHALEARIIAQAGLPGAVTIVTAMAGRGTDIRLGGVDGTKADAVLAAGGLLVIGTERHASRRLDDQLRGRAGRQGDPGRTVFLSSLEDPLFRQFGTAGSQHLEGHAPAWVRKALDKAQAMKEARDFEARKAVLEFDDIVHAQRQVVHAKRDEFLRGVDRLSSAKQILRDVTDDLIKSFVPRKTVTPANLADLDRAVRAILTLAVPFDTLHIDDPVLRGRLRELIVATADDWLAKKVSAYGAAMMDHVLNRIFLSVLDQLWSEQLERLEHLRQVVGNRRLTRSAVLPEFKIEAFDAFRLMLREFDHEVATHMMRVGVTPSRAASSADPILA